MRLSILSIALAAITSIIAAPTPEDSSLESRATSQLEDRTFFNIWGCDPRCKDTVKINACAQKGSGWALDKDCNQHYQPSTCSWYCPDYLEGWGKCALQGKIFDPTNCVCKGYDIPAAPCKCDQSQWQWCSTKGGVWDNDKCDCKMPSNSCQSWPTVWGCKQKGKECNSGCGCY